MRVSGGDFADRTTAFTAGAGVRPLGVLLLLTRP